MDITVTHITAEPPASCSGSTKTTSLTSKAVDVSPAGITKAASGFGNTSGGKVYVGVDESVGANGRERTWRGFRLPRLHPGNGPRPALFRPRDAPRRSLR